MRLRWVVLVVLCAAVSLNAQTHFSFTTNTGVNAIVGIAASVTPTIAGAPIVVGDEIGVFTPGGMCVGAAVWSGQSVAITVWGDNPITPAVDGMKAGESILYRLWQKSSSTELATVTATYSLGSGIFEVNGLYMLASLSTPVLPPGVVTLTSPANGAVNVSAVVTLQWVSLAAAMSYNLELSPDSLFSVLVMQTSVPTASKQTSSLKNNATYYWRVQAVNTGGAGAWSAVFRFTTPSTHPGPPTPVLPVSGAVDVSTTPLLIWEPGADAVSYTVQVALDPLFRASYTQYSVRTPSIVLPRLTGGMTHYWRVQSVNQAGSSAWTSVSMFRTTNTDIPPVPSVVSPADRAVNVAVDAVLKWTPVEGASSYLVDVTADSSFDTILERSVQPGTTKELYPMLSLGKTYYWRVRSENGPAVSNFSPIYRFTVTEVYVGVRPDAALPDGFVLDQNYPNPFNPSTTVRFTIPPGVSGRMTLRVYDVLGSEVAVLADGPASAGVHTAVWNAAGAASGVYLCRLTAGNIGAARTMLFAK